MEIKRNAYLQQLTLRKDNGMIKVFTGRMFKAAISKYMAHRKEKKLEKQRSRRILINQIR